jgi:hypothetical protein
MLRFVLNAQSLVLSVICQNQVRFTVHDWLMRFGTWPVSRLTIRFRDRSINTRTWPVMV